MRTLAVVAVFCCACGGTTTTNICTGMATGKLTGTFSVCNDFDARYRQNLDTFGLTADYTELPSSFTWSTDWELKGEPTAKTFSETTPAVKCNISMKKGNQTWVARVGAGVAAAGTCSMVLTDVGTGVVDGNVTTYPPLKGTIAGHLEADPMTMATGTVDVTMDFCSGDSKMCMPPMM